MGSGQRNVVGEHLGDEEEAGDSGEEVINMGTTPASDRIQLAGGVRADIHFYDAMGRLRRRPEKWTEFARDLGSCLGRVKGPAAVTPHLGKGQVGSECGVIAVYTCACAILLSMGELGEAMPINYEMAPDGRYNEHVERLLRLFNVHILAHAQKEVKEATDEDDRNYFEKLIEAIAQNPAGPSLT